MAYKKDYGQDAENGIIWDLRQIYAVEILGRTLTNIQEARLSDNFPLWFKLLKRDLSTIISHKLAPEEITELNTKTESLKKVLIKNSNAYQKKDCTALEYQQVEDALCDFEKYLYSLIEEHKMFGQREEDIGL